MYMMWFDDSKKPQAEKIADAIEAYVKHFKTKPNHVLVNEAEQAEVPGMYVQVASYIRRFNIWVGWKDPV